MTSFYVDHGSYDEVNNILMSAVRNMGTILDNLSSFLNNMNQAVSGQAAPLWADQQSRWNQSYADMQQKLSAGALASVEAANIFRDGDQRGASIMS